MSAQSDALENLISAVRALDGATVPPHPRITSEALAKEIATAISELLSTIDVGLNTGDIDPRLLAQYKLLTSVTWETPSEVHSTKFMATFTLPTVFGPHFRVAVFQEPPPSLASR